MSDSAPAVAPWGRGKVLWGKYTVVQQIGRGGMATVYEAVHRNGKRVALKVLHQELMHHDVIVERFYREGRASQLVKHPGVVEVYDDGQSETHEHVLVCEFLDGCTLRQLLDASDGGLPNEEVFGYLDEALAVLEAAHAAGVIHRDIKPENLFLTTEGRLKLLDFGVARMPTNVGATPTSNGDMLGTPAYMAPEQARGRSELVGVRSDLWSLAATTVALLSGDTPRRAATVNEVLLLAMTKPVDPVKELCPGLPLSVARVLDRALATEPESRYASASEMRAAIAEARSRAADFVATPTFPLSGVGKASVPPTLTAGRMPVAPAPVDQTKSQHSRRAIAVSLFAVVVIGAGLVILQKMRPSAPPPESVAPRMADPVVSAPPAPISPSLPVTPVDDVAEVPSVSRQVSAPSGRKTVVHVKNPPTRAAVTPPMPTSAIDDKPPAVVPDDSRFEKRR